MKTTTYTLNSIFIFLAALGLFVLTSSRSIAQTNFSGTWTLNQEKSNLGDLPFRIASDKIVIEQGKNDVTMRRTGQGPMGTVETNEKFTFDGKECENQFFGNNKKTSVATWPDKKVLNIKSKASFVTEDGQPMDITIDENYSLSDDGKTLTIAYGSTSSFGDIKQTQVYTK